MSLEDGFILFKEIDFPKTPQSDEFNHWVSDFIMIDAYYSGLIDKVINGEKVQIDSTMFDVSYKKLTAFIPRNDDREVYNNFLIYTRSLLELINLVKKQYDK